MGDMGVFARTLTPLYVIVLLSLFAMILPTIKMRVSTRCLLIVFAALASLVVVTGISKAGLWFGIVAGSLSLVVNLAVTRIFTVGST